MSLLRTRRKSPLYQNGDHDDKKTSVAGQDISESGHMNESYENGPSKGDLIRGSHLQYHKDGLVKDLDYKLQFDKDTTDASGSYKIWKTTGTK